MIHFEYKDFTTHIIQARRAIIIHELEYSSFKENLFVLGAGKRVQIKPEEISFIDFNLIFFKHIPNYNNPVQPFLDVKHLLSKCNWTSKQNYGLPNEED